VVRSTGAAAANVTVSLRIKLASCSGKHEHDTRHLPPRDLRSGRSPNAWIVVGGFPHDQGPLWRGLAAVPVFAPAGNARRQLVLLAGHQTLHNLGLVRPHPTHGLAGSLLLCGSPTAINTGAVVKHASV